MLNVIGGCTAASTNNIYKSFFCPFFNDVCGLVRLFIVFAKGIGQTGVGIDHDQGIGDFGQRLHMRAQLRGTERAVEADGHGPCVTHRVPERLNRVAREVAARKVGQGH